MILIWSNPRNCKMTFIIGQSFAERQILKTWKWPWTEWNILITFCVNIDKQENEKGHFSSVEALPSSKFWKINDNGAISWTEWNIVIKFCIPIDIEKMYPIRLSNDIWVWLSICRGSNSEKSETCKMTFIIGRGFAEHQILKKWKWPYLLNRVEYFHRLLHKQWYWQDLAQEIAKCHFSSVEVLPSSKFWKKW